MKPKEFVAYLTGAIEVNDLKEFNPEQYKIVNEKLNLVKIDDSPEGNFCVYVKGFFDGNIEESVITSKNLSKLSTKIKELENKSENINKPVPPKSPNQGIMRC